jgi:hypothetical protein
MARKKHSNKSVTTIGKHPLIRFAGIWLGFSLLFWLVLLVGIQSQCDECFMKVVYALVAPKVIGLILIPGFLLAACIFVGIYVGTRMKKRARYN